MEQDSGLTLLADMRRRFYNKLHRESFSDSDRRRSNLLIHWRKQGMPQLDQIERQTRERDESSSDESTDEEINQHSDSDDSSEGEDVYDLKARLRKINYDGWKIALAETKSLAPSITVLEAVMGFLSLSDGEKKYIEGEKKINQVRCFLTVMIHRPDQAGELHESLQKSLIPAAKILEENIMSLDRRYFVRPVHEKINLEDAAAFDTVIRENVERIDALALWAIDSLYSNEVITKEEWYSYNNYLAAKKRHLFDLLLRRNSQQRKNFIRFLNENGLTELRQRLMAGPRQKVQSQMTYIPFPCHFVLRKKYTKQITRALREWKDCGLETKPFWIIVHGSSGVGKSTLVAHVVKKARLYNFSNVIWITQGMRSEEEVMGDILFQLSGKTFPSDLGRQIRTTLKLQEAMNKRCLLVIDDLMNASILNKVRHFNFVIVTTIFKKIVSDFHDIDCVSIPVLQFNKKYCKRLLNNVVHKDLMPLPQILLEGCMKVCHDCDYSPYATTQIGRKINERQSWVNREKDFLASLEREFSFYSENEVGWMRGTKIHPAFKIALDLLKDDEKEKFYKLVVFRNETFSPATMASIWKVTEDQAYDILKLFYDSSLIQMNIGSMKSTFSLNNVQRYSLQLETEPNFKAIIHSVVEAYKSKDLASISDQDRFYFENFVLLCLVDGDHETALTAMSSFQFLLRRLETNAGQHILRDFYETMKGPVTLSKTFRELWYLADILVPQVLQLNCPELWTQAALLQHPSRVSRMGLETMDSPDKGDYTTWRFDEKPRIVTSTWIPKLFKRKIKVQGEGFTSKTFASAIDVSKNEMWIVVGTNIGIFHVISGATFHSVLSRNLTSFVFFVQFIDENRFIVVSNTLYNCYRIADDVNSTNEFGLEEEFTIDISICRECFSPIDDSDAIKCPLIQPVAANSSYLWVMCDEDNMCFVLPPTQSNQKPGCYKHPNRHQNGQILYRHASASNAKDECMRRFAAFTDGLSIIILKYQCQEKVVLFQNISVTDCCIVELTDDWLLYSVEKTVTICKWKPNHRRLRTVPLDCKPDLTKPVPNSSRLVIGTIGKSFTVFDVDRGILEVLPVEKPQAVVIESAEGKRNSNVFTCSDEGWVSKTLLFNRPQRRSSSSIVPVNSADRLRFLSRFSIMLRYLNPFRSPRKNEVLLFHWLHNRGYLAVFLYDQSRREKCVDIVLLQSCQTLISCRRPKSDFSNGDLHAWCDGSRVVVYNETFILDFSNLPENTTLNELPWTLESKCALLTSFGPNSCLAAFTSSGAISRHDGQTWTTEDQLVIPAVKCLELLGLKSSNKLVGLVEMEVEGYFVVVVDLDVNNFVFVPGAVCKDLSFKICPKERFLVVFHENTHMTTVYTISDAAPYASLSGHRVTSIAFHPSEASKLFITYFHESARRLFLRIWQFSDENEIDGQQHLREICVNTCCDNISVLDERCYPVLSSTFMSDGSYLLIVTEKTLIRVDPNRMTRDEYSQTIFDIGWIGGGTGTVRECIPGNDGQYLCLSTSDGNVYILKSVYVVNSGDR